MPEIRPMRDLRDTNTISRLCHTTAKTGGRIWLL